MSENITSAWKFMDFPNKVLKMELQDWIPGLEILIAGFENPDFWQIFVEIAQIVKITIFVA
jgi:hypothetical protein